MNILLLQGPMGPFFARLRDQLQAEGHTVYKINFNGGDVHYYQDERTHTFQGRLTEWEEYLHNFLSRRRIQAIFAYGDCRYYHRIATRMAKEHAVNIYYYEEGYLRPNFITLEKGGVNANSPICRLKSIPGRDTNIIPSEELKSDFLFRIWYASVYYLIGHLTKKKFPHYRHHRSFNPYYELRCWLRAYWRKLIHYFPDWIKLNRLIRCHSDQYFFVPLQIRDDAQIKKHSKYDSIDSFIHEVMASFARHAPLEQQLLFKHHPLDRGHTSYQKTIDRLTKKFGLKGRVTYVLQGANPVILQHCRGVITINSTMGFSALVHGKQTLALGKAVYKREGLTFSGELDQFWFVSKTVDKSAVQQLRSYILENTQISGSFYRRIPDLESTYSLVVRSLKEVRTEMKTPIVGSQNQVI
ncbi:MAG: capsule biosynthesis protein [Oligoflexus sp.]